MIIQQRFIVFHHFRSAPIVSVTTCTSYMTFFDQSKAEKCRIIALADFEVVTLPIVQIRNFFQFGRVIGSLFEKVHRLKTVLVRSKIIFIYELPGVL